MMTAPRTAEEVAAIVAEYERGVPMRTIRETHRIGCGKPYRILREHGVKERGIVGPRTEAPPEYSSLLLDPDQINAPGRGEWDIDRIAAIAQDRDAQTAMDVAETFARGGTRVLIEYVEAYARARREAGIT